MSDGLVVVDKPGGWTSHQVVGRLRRLMGTRRVGHAGTLDPMATGVLLVGVGRATRLLGQLSLTDKAYTATVRLGQSTVTDDAEGEVLTASGVTGLGLDAVEAAMGHYRGTIIQVPATVSAIKVDGQRAYARARRGEQVTLAGREVTVSRFELMASRRADADGVVVLDLEVAVDCSSGTYVRALARDLGAELGVGGHLTALRRTRVGPFTLEDPHLEPDQLDAAAAAVPVIGMAAVARRCFEVVELDPATAAGVRHGRALDWPVPAAVTALLSGEELLALYRREGAGSVPIAVFAAP